MKKNNKGFTLVELIVVIAILGVLMAVLVPQYIQYVERSRQGTDASALGEILHAAEVESATVEDASGNITVAITASTGAVTISQPASGGAPQALIDNVNSVAGTGLAMKSKAAKLGKTLTISIDTTGVKWDSAGDAWIKLLVNGSAPKAADAEDE